MKFVTTNSHKPPMHLSFHLLHCYVDKASSSRSLTCICDPESRSPRPLSSTILHWERANKVFGNYSMRLLDHFFKFITTRLPFPQASANRHGLQCVVVTEWRLHNSTIVKDEKTPYVLFSLITYYMLNLVICIVMILLDLLQCLICIILIHLSTTYDSTIVLICNLLFMFMIYFWIKIKLKVLLFSTEGNSAAQRQGRWLWWGTTSPGEGHSGSVADPAGNGGAAGLLRQGGSIVRHGG
jgi:hypothetical protein